MKEDFLFSLFFVWERHKARDGLLADQRNFNLKIRKLSISKINSISRTAEELWLKDLYVFKKNESKLLIMYQYIISWRIWN